MDARESRAVVTYPKPPAMHWGWVLLLHVLTFGIFSLIWTLRQAAWVRQIDPASKAAYLFAVALGLEAFVVFAADDAWTLWAPMLTHLAGTGLGLWAFVSMRHSVQDRFAADLSIGMTIFFNVFYLQYHLARIAADEYPTRCLALRT
jgi:hypothetical protein